MKIHLVCDGQGRPLAFMITGGNVNDCTQFEPVVARIRITRCGWSATRTTRPATSAPTCANAVSPAPSRKESTRSADACGGARACAVSTVRAIDVATSPGADSAAVQVLLAPAPAPASESHAQAYGVEGAITAVA
ncbi:hypothetical protein GCM10020254_46150 [Streptomyces goshikiensis]